MKAIGSVQRLANFVTERGASQCTNRNRHQSPAPLSDLGPRQSAKTSADQGTTGLLRSIMRLHASAKSEADDYDH
jgi:hypothetical protein